MITKDVASLEMKLLSLHKDSIEVGKTYVFNYGSEYTYINRIKELTPEYDMVVVSAICIIEEEFRFNDNAGYTAYFREATEEESDWMDRCIEADKYVRYGV